jgi:DNA topoisomerase-6 subunit A
VVIGAAQRSQDPTLSIPGAQPGQRHLRRQARLIEMGRRKQERTFFNVGMAKKFMQTVLVADALAELQRANLTLAARDLLPHQAHDQELAREHFRRPERVGSADRRSRSDARALREELHVRAENSGTVVGPWFCR